MPTMVPFAECTLLAATNSTLVTNQTGGVLGVAALRGRPKAGGQPRSQARCRPDPAPT